MNYKKILQSISLAIFIPLFLPSSAFASTQSVTITPSVIKIQALPPAQVVAPVYIENTSDNDETFQVSYKPFTINQDGEAVYEDFLKPSSDNFLKHVQIAENGSEESSVQVAPHQKKRVELRIDIPNGQSFSESYFSVIFAQNKDGTDGNVSNIRIAQATLVILTIGPVETPQASIEEFSTKLLQEKGPVPFLVKLKNQGNQATLEKGYIVISNMFGQTIGKVDLASTYIPKGATRLIPEDPNQLSKTQSDTVKKAMGGTLYAWWPEKILFGLYRADLYISLFPNGPLYQRAIHFLSFPIKTVVIALGIIIILFWIKNRIGKHL